MRLLPLLFLTALASACSAPAFEITVTNAGTATTYLAASEGTGVRLTIEEEIRGEFRPLGISEASFCAPRCGALGSVVCALVRAELNRVHALLPGDSTTRSFPANQWRWMTDAGCLRSTTLSGPARAVLCHGAEAQTSAGEALDEPDRSGLLGLDEEASVVDAFCEELPFDLSESTSVVLEVAD
jgi:hypothetical protein